MENASVIGLSRQITLQRNMDVIANNLANMSTAGFKADHLIFEEHVSSVAQINDLQYHDRKVSFVHTPAEYRNFAPGDMQPTGNDLDVAVVGKGWLVVQTPDGERYTRNGQLTLNNQGQISTSEGHLVLGDGGPITIDTEETGISIAEDGTISTNQGEKGRLRLVSFANEAQMSKEGTSLFSATIAPEAAENARLMQGMVEKSNVQPVLEMTKMIETIRAYTNTAQNLQQIDQLRRDAIQQLGNTNSA